MIKTAFFSRRQPGGFNNIEDQSLSTGSRFFVHSGTGTNGSGYGRNPDAPCATIDYAIGLCTANKGDIIYVMPGHAESIATATALIADIAGITILGIGWGSLIPTITLGTATTATVSVTAADVKMKNIKLISDLADVAAGITASNAADGLVVEDCWLTDGGLTKELVIGVSLAAGCDNVLIINNRFNTTVSAETGGCASAVKLAGASNNSRIIHNYMHGHFTAAAIDGATAASTSIYIEDNHIMQIDTGAGKGIDLHASTSGAVIRNLVCNLKDATDGIVAAGCLVAENYGSNAAGASGLIKPAVDS